MPRFSSEFLDELKSRLKPSAVVGRHVKLRKQGNEWAGLSPFTKEKTPSFFVNDVKGFYHCFSSGKHGDIISFLVETQGLTFQEAVARLAEEAGLALPAEEPGEAERAVRRKGLSEATAAAAAFYEQTLNGPEGRGGAEYFRARGLSPEQIAAFRLGYAPAGRVALKEHLLFKGFTEDVLLEAGLLVRPEAGGASYDRFRGRVMFPILSANGQVVAFGGRALEKDAKPKYLNSPETPLFHKGDVLYNFGAARKAAAETGAALVVCEGYMDVIALWGAGFRTAVAPLGTALGETQLQLLWRHGDEPYLCLDGDRAGVSAAHRVIDRALPLLKPGKSLAFVFLPDEQDPDDLVRRAGPDAFRAALRGAEPLVEVLWRREVAARPLDTPERRAALKAHLRDLVKAIADKDVRAAYGAELAGRLEAAFPRPPAAGVARATAGRDAPRKTGPGGNLRARRFGPTYAEELAAARPSQALKSRREMRPYNREASLVLAVIRHPDLFERHEGDVLGLVLDDPALGALLGETVAAILSSPGLDSDRLRRHIGGTVAADTLERILSDETLNAQFFLRPAAEPDEVDRGWKDTLRVHEHARNARSEVALAAAEGFAHGEESWLAAVKHREETQSKAEPSGGDAGDEENASGQKLAGSLEALRASVDRRSRRG